ncbi:MAG: hypothetical protein A2339_07830 [Elusimicrobia bacterium RIFOXYB12_FULL_50_12]|nr:MAG: hypothetical protein A2386_07900 [Elusimicrobia bacterium RIFOXYB1_FULL_48_9]OGS16430.1 MAG: hypothetical protein A2251_06355 [Elusimicrobia bacterium RIFOXYA2_FULL_47_53]OGS27195.1 MAG: hypothetical protein A2339_07830 [Elusimicrobia bacterium RIFOXYB12_FULL_50_12]OGS30394.1 MAG: hypothetical protein A2323_02690 [Elusimicrobia bacterium RIFOXYB2_FULL_46_23]
MKENKNTELEETMAKILIMDDEPALRNVVYNMVKPLGHPLFTAEDGKQAIEIGAREVPDLALLDMRVPDMDGLEVLAELKKINPNIKCIMLSGFGDVETAVSSIKQGAFDYISKPFKIDEVLKVVNKALGAVPAQGQAAAAAAAPASKPQAAVSAPAAAKKPLPKGILIGAGAALLIALAVIFGRGLFSSGAVQEFAIPYANPTGISSIGQNLWVTDWVMGNIYQHNKDAKLSIASVYKSANSQPTGLTYDGEKLWTCSSIEKRIYRHNMDASLTVEAIFATSGGNPSGLYFDGANLWVLDSEAAKIYKHKMDETISMIGTFDSPAINPCGMFKSGENFFIGDYKTGRIYKVSVKDFSVSDVYEIPYFVKNNYKLAGITSDGKTLWASADGIGKIFNFSFNSMKEVKY